MRAALSPLLPGGIALAALAAIFVPACLGTTPSDPHACPISCPGGPGGDGSCYIPEDACSDTCGAEHCSDDADCGPDRACIKCASFGVCSAKPVACELDADCGDPNFACVDRVCARRACKVDGDCNGYCLHDTCYWLGYQCQYC